MSGPPWDNRLARQVVRALAHTPLTPNHVTTIGLFCGIVAGLLFSSGERALENWAAIIFVLAAFLDHVDGELARRTGRVSALGHVYDHVAAGVSYVAMFVGIGFGQRHGPLGDWAVPLAVVAGISVFAAMRIRFQMEKQRGKTATEQPSFMGFEAEDILYLVAPVAWLDWLLPFLVAAGVGAPIFVLWVLWERQRQRGRDARAGVGQR